MLLTVDVNNEAILSLLCVNEEAPAVLSCSDA